MPRNQKTENESQQSACEWAPPTCLEFGPGPVEALDRFQSQNDAFVIDQRCERFLMTLNPREHLKQSKPRGPDCCVHHMY